MNSRERIFNLFKGGQADHLSLMPITMQLATDSIGKKYKEYATDHRVLVEGQLKVAEEFDFDHVSVISDPTREAADCGASIIFSEDSPPAIDNQNNLLADKTKLASLKMPDVLGGGRMQDRVEGVALFKEKIGSDKIIEGWIEGPCAEGADLRGINTLMMDFFDDPGFVRDLFEFVIEMELNFAKFQIEAGVDVMGMGDAAASLIGPELYEEFVWPYEKRLIDGVHELGAAVRLHICGNTRDILKGIGRLGCEIVDMDYMVPISQARAKMGQAQIICGNIDPVSVLRDSTPEQIHQAIEQCHKEAGGNFIVGAGCEVTRDTPPENLRVLTDYAHSH
ncbi:MAG: uroporphyrinogen decarboxylase family protein [Phycisphaerae bacterium]|nr:uroporphyrinogen decarboxylase family protein [Phycisphaerae bacterium]